MNSLGEGRIPWLDTARSYGMALVFFGHIVGIYAKESVAASMQCKFVYSFHMPLFFIVAGYLARREPVSRTKAVYQLVTARIIPLLFFNVIVVPLWYLYPVGRADTMPMSEFLLRVKLTLVGLPVFNWITWFIICLFVTELFHVFLGPLLRKPGHIVVTGVCSYLVGYFVTENASDLGPVFARVIRFWYFGEAFVAYAFYLFGRLLCVSGLESKTRRKDQNATLALVCLVLTAATFHLNTVTWGALAGSQKVKVAYVAMTTLNHGNILLFPFTAITGSLGVIALSRLTPAHRWITYWGQHSLVLMGLNGFFLIWLNVWIARSLSSIARDTHGSVFLLCTIVTILSMLVCVPVIELLERLVPQLIGRPRKKGPLLPNLI